MGFTAITNNLDWAHVDFLNEYVDAINERCYAQDPDFSNPIATVVLDDDVQDKALIELFQTRCEAARTVGDWADSHNYPGGFHGETEVWHYTGWAALSAAAGIPDGWRRATTKPSDWTDYNDAAYSYGKIQAGDIIGPWLFADLQAVLKKLVWTYGRDQAISPHLEGYCPLPNNWYQGYSGVNLWDTCAAAKAAAEADWAVEGQTLGPHCVSTINFAGVPAWPDWTARLLKMKWGARFKSTYTLWAGCDRTVDWYLKTIDPSAGSGTKTYNDNGEGLVKDAVGLFDTTGPNNDAQPASRYLPTDYSMPDWCICPVVQGTQEQEGWSCSAANDNWWAVVKWNVANGFVYV